MIIFPVEGVGSGKWWFHRPRHSQGGVIVKQGFEEVYTQRLKEGNIAIIKRG